MNILAIEASAKVAGAAVMVNGELRSEQMTSGMLTHSQTLMPLISRVMEAAGLSGDQVDVIAFTNGPGSFTGLRIGAATAKGLALGWKKPVLPLSTLEVTAENGRIFQGLVVPVMDARRNQVYTAVYRNASEKMEPIFGPEAASVRQLLDFLEQQEEPVLLLGDIYAVEKEEIPEGLSARLVKAPEHLRQIRPGACCSLADRKMAAGEQPVPSDQVKVEYLRKSQAEREYEARHAHVEQD